MYGCILKPKNCIPLYYCYEIIYDNPKMAKSDIENHYHKSSSFNFEDCNDFNSLYELLDKNYIIRIGDIISIDDNYYFYAPKLVKIIC